MSKAVRKALEETTLGLKAMILNGESAFAEQFFGNELSLVHMLWMCDRIVENVAAWPVDKTGRWIGFVQGVLACHQILDVNAERDRTRPIFHAAYAAVGEEIPKTLDRPTP